ncbi:putative alcohol dehydrogenase [Pusillimonas sp. T7-7]|uniref:iron-containing alcohol dehydrogenase n=1 Tax=Pusillimonas sp. (strain T7-7) TaxID=1007105 RepID=UPI0002085054|nr:iron-containing alcohol dehydrogenase [Pusillimonas sp. T7-7]AEC20122.1 putative alcohol dehydrogenase [Pusillimonas sp. T7-7]
MTKSIASFSYHIPTAIEFGWGALARLPEIIQQCEGTRVLLVADPGVVAAGVAQQVINALDHAHIPNFIFSEVESDPDVSSVDKGLEKAKSEGCDVVIGVGGGSSLDIAKAIGLMLKNPGNIRDYAGVNLVKQSGAPVIAIPTTSGTGSELTIWSVLSDKAQQKKLSIGSVLNCARVALLDPQLTLTLPAAITAQTGMDALTHALESYVNKATQPISEAMSEQAMALIAKSLRTAVAQPDNTGARADMLLASTIAAMAFNNTRLGLVHAFAMPLGAQFHIPHGLVNAIMLPAVMRFNLTGNLKKYARIAEIFGEKVDVLSQREAAERSVVAIEQLKRDIGITANLSSFGVKETDLDSVVDEALLSGNVPVNPRQPTHDDMKALLRSEMKESA